MIRNNILRGEAREVVNHCKVAVQAHVSENTEKASAFDEVFTVTGCNF